MKRGLQGYLVLSGSTPLEAIADYVYQPTRVLKSVADLIDELKNGTPSSRLDSPVFERNGSPRRPPGHRHQTDAEHPQKPRPRQRAPMTR